MLDLLCHEFLLWSHTIEMIPKCKRKEYLWNNFGSLSYYCPVVLEKPLNKDVLLEKEKFWQNWFQIVPTFLK